ncbi:TetR/AcrR family transcriptional regulator [Streptosporangium sp. NBC_01469]|uniref:TetR/AcrR family transcriptional regulator n=1 Tax=Streptosporangium sp. NBC_01469 TaxID=2903898 RepID=UPI002E2E787D|nr:TetR/AcrR family transcriptional regulator [Streptosporangium sp. NBC_01469]
MSATPGRRTRRRSGEETPGVWLRPPREGRAEPVVTLGRIVGAAVELLDEEGADRLTMRRLAERLETAATTLYLHVETKDDVLDLALDAVFGEVPVPPGPRGAWRDDVTALIAEWRATMLRHPWSVTVLDRPLLGPNVLARTEYLHAALAGAGFTGPDLTAAAYALANYVIGSATMEVAGAAYGEAGWRRAAELRVRSRVELYPTLAAHGAPIGNAWDPVFTTGLGYLLDGIESRTR